MNKFRIPNKGQKASVCAVCLGSLASDSFAWRFTDENGVDKAVCSTCRDKQQKENKQIPEQPSLP